jgi:hypothetical protein
LRRGSVVHLDDARPINGEIAGRIVRGSAQESPCVLIRHTAIQDFCWKKNIPISRFKQDMLSSKLARTDGAWNEMNPKTGVARLRLGKGIPAYSYFPQTRCMVFSLPTEVQDTGALSHEA